MSIHCLVNNVNTRMSTLQILLVNERRFWQPGDWLEGVVILTWPKRRTVRGVRLELSGEVHTCWMNSVSHRHKGTRCSSERVLNTVFTFWGFPRGSTNETTLEPGLYVWPFRIALPPTITDASVEHHLGHVRYELKAYVDMPWDMDIEFSRPLHVVPRMPLSSRPDLLVPVSDEKQTEINRWCCIPNGSIEVTAVCGKRGVVPGVQIPVTVHIENNSGETITGITLALVEHLDFFACGEHRADERELAVLEYNQRVKAHARAHEIPLSLSIPAGLPNPSFDGRYIRRSHLIIVRVLIDGIFTSDIDLSFPVVAFSTSFEIGVPPDIAPSMFNPEGLPRQKFYLPIGQAKFVAPLCLDALDYNPIDQLDLNNRVRYPTFFSPNFTIPQTLQQYNRALYQLLLQNFIVIK